MTKQQLAIILALLITAATAKDFVNSVLANPYTHIFPVYSGETAPRSDTQPPKITVLSPEHNSTLNTKSISVSFKVEVGESKSAESKMIWNVYYKADWLEDKTIVYEYVSTASTYPDTKSNFSATLNLTEIPEGKHSVTVCATEKGTYYDPPFSEWPMWALEFKVKSYSFQIVGASAISFAIDTTPLTVTVLPIADQILSESGTSDTPLNFTVNGSASEIWYTLDGQNKVEIAGNTTLADLSVGAHNVIVYARDAAGNLGRSETVAFTVAELERFPTVPVVTLSSMSIVAVAAAALLFYNKKRRKEAQQT